ncbi:hypothetical protein BGLA2_1520006 [Burkholderia gladioli]|nr:hypothetical protein BGLA2_1520006 [Burkholderia gladioli]
MPHRNGHARGVRAVPDRSVYRPARLSYDFAMDFPIDSFRVRCLQQAVSFRYKLPIEAI